MRKIPFFLNRPFLIYSASMSAVALRETNLPLFKKMEFWKDGSQTGPRFLCKMEYTEDIGIDETRAAFLQQHGHMIKILNTFSSAKICFQIEKNQPDLIDVENIVTAIKELASEFLGIVHKVQVQSSEKAINRSFERFQAKSRSLIEIEDRTKIKVSCELYDATTHLALEHYF